MSSAAADATVMLRHMVEDETRGWGEKPDAIRSIARRCKASFWTVNRILIGRTKSMDADLGDRIRSAFVNHCREHAARLLREAEIAAAKDKSNVDLRTVAGEIQALVARLEAAKGEAKSKEEVT